MADGWLAVSEPATASCSQRRLTVRLRHLLPALFWLCLSQTHMICAAMVLGASALIGQELGKRDKGEVASSGAVRKKEWEVL